MLTVDEVCRDFFAHLTPAKFIRKAVTGEITLPVVRMDSSVKAARAVHLSDLADYLDDRRAAARSELEQIGWAGDGSA